MSKSVAVVLTGGIAACIALLPWGRWTGATDPEVRLTERVAEYTKLRQQDDWVTIYSMVDGRDRQAVPLHRFLMLYARGTLKVISLEKTSHEIDLPRGTATVKMNLEAELQLDKLSPQMRGSLGPQKPEDLRKTSEFPTTWYWDEGTWWLRLDPEAVTGRAADGTEIKPSGK